LSGLIALESGRARQSTGALRTLAAGSALFRAGTPANSIYAVRQGMLKSVHVSIEGDEHVLGTQIPGDVLGLEAFALENYAHDAIALQPVVCCELPLPICAEQSTRSRDLGTALVRLLSRAAGPRAHPARGSARQRVTAFLLDLAQRLERRGLESHEFALGLSRQELANLLDTRIETVSRTVQQLHREQAIRIDGGSVELRSLTP
jgi:CRP/FNR family transcriptional regulator